MVLVTAAEVPLALMDCGLTFARRAHALLGVQIRLLADAVAAVADALPAAIGTGDHAVLAVLTGTAADPHKAGSFSPSAGVTKHEAPRLRGTSPDSVRAGKGSVMSSCPALCRASTSCLTWPKTWMAGTSPAMTSIVSFNEEINQIAYWPIPRAAIISPIRLRA